MDILLVAPWLAHYLVRAAMAGPAFQISKVYKIDGGPFAKGKRDIHDVVNISGIDFMPLSCKNRNLVPLLMKHGKRESSGRPCCWPRGVVRILKSARNTCVDDHIKQHLRAEDPMAEVDAQINDMSDKDRYKHFHKAGVPQIVSLAMPPFTTDSGEHCPLFNVRVLTSPKKRKQVFIELVSANFNWLMYASQVTTDKDSDDEPMDSEDEAEKLEIFRKMLPAKVHLGVNTRKKHSWFIRCYTNRRLKQVTFNYAYEDSEDDIRARLDVALKDLHKKAGIEEA